MAKDIVSVEDRDTAIETAIDTLLDPPTKRYFGGTAQLSVRVMPATVPVIDHTARELGLTRADLVRTAIAEFLDKHRDVIEVDYAEPE